PPVRGLCAAVGWVARLLLRGCREHATQMERGVAAAAAERAQAVDYGLRIVAQEQVGLAYAGWDRLLTRVALPAWRMGRWPSRLDAGVVAALTELSRRDRLAEGFTSRLGERPACDLLEEPGAVDEAASLLAARLFHGGPATPCSDWAPVDWQAYPEEVVDRTWRVDAARLHRALDALGVRPSRHSGTPDPGGPTLARVLDHLTTAGPAPAGPAHPHEPLRQAPAPRASDDGGYSPQGPPPSDDVTRAGGVGGRDMDADGEAEAEPGTDRSVALAARLTAELAREEARTQRARTGAATAHQSPDSVAWAPGDYGLPPFPLQPHRTARELLADHVTAMVCCAAVDTAGAVPALDWLDGPSLLLGGERAADLAPKVLTLIEDGDPGPLRDWLTAFGIRPEKPVRLV
ncbi:hypothetical protein JHN54_18680, partial [Streptomyces sp. MBT70]|nr:hypothetical protein [Streptomyces sp. MBT70]